MDIDKILKRTQAEREEEDRWWLNLTKEEREAHLKKLADEERSKEMLKVLIALALIGLFIVLPAIAVAKRLMFG